MPDFKPPEIPLQIQLDEETANGKYVNMALVNHNETEFTLDFIYVQPQALGDSGSGDVPLHPPRGRVLSRIITNPKHMKRLLLAIQDNVSKFEARFGPIEREPENPIH